MTKIYSFGKAERDKINKTKVIGPGQYEPKIIKGNLPKYSFGKSKKGFNIINNTPGPIYNIKKPSLKKSPQFSIKGRYQNKINSLNPGPGAYDPDPNKISSKKNPVFSIGQKLNEIKNNEKNQPGPGEYETFNQKSQQYGIFGKNKKRDLINNNKCPGPGTYFSNFVHHSNQFGIFGKSTRNNIEKNYTPGPGTYDVIKKNENSGTTLIPRRLLVNSNVNKIGPGDYYKEDINIIKNKNPSYKFGKEKKLKLENYNQNPTSNNYQNIQFMNEGPKWKFGSSLKGNLRPNSAFVPGPGRYNNSNCIGTGKKYTLRPKLEFKENGNNEVVGPGSYEINYLSNNSGCKIGKEKKFNKSNQLNNGPGPGTYEISNNKNKLNGKFGKNNRLENANSVNNNPGPGNYNIRNNDFDNKSNAGFLLTSNNKKNVFFENVNPGPGNYNPNDILIKKRPVSCKIAKNINKQKNYNLNPGPGTYDICEKNKNYNTGCFFGSGNKLKLDSDNNIPGPGKYGNFSTIGKGKKYSFRPKLNPNYDNNQTPGPCNYNLKLNYTKINSPKINFKTDQRFKEQKNHNQVGPGQYNIIKKIEILKGGAIGKSQRIDSGLSNKNPGPGNYNVKSIFEDNINNIKGCSLTPKRPISSLNQSNNYPGPGQYQGDYSKIRPLSPNCKLGKERRFENAISKKLESNPGPGIYYNEDKLDKSSTLFGKSQRFKNIKIENNPGPGNYYNSEKKNEAPSFSMRKKLEKEYKKLGPGPGTYNLKTEYVYNNNKGARFSNDAKFKNDFNKAEEPGPGAYTQENTNKGVKYSFGKNTRDNNLKNDVPGPGNYDLKGSFDEWKK